MRKFKCRRNDERPSPSDGGPKPNDECLGRGVKSKRMPELWQVVVECRNEAEQREVFERMKGEGRKVRVMVL